MGMQSFLRLVLPGEGHYAWVGIKQKKVQQGHVDTIEKLCTVLTALDEKGFDAYFGCASYKEPGSRTQSNVHMVKSFWLDIDCGEGKEHETKEQAEEAVRIFCKAASLPYPLVVCSGYGLHCYYPLDVELTESLWKIHANNLHKLCEENGLRVDPKRTRDSASILRPPETSNYKYGKSVPVFVEEQGTDTPVVYSTDGICRILSKGQLAGLSIRADNYSLSVGFPDGQRTDAMLSRLARFYGKGQNPNDVREKILRWNRLNTPPLPEEKVLKTIETMWETHKRNHPQTETITELPELQWGWEWKSNEVWSKPYEDDDGEVYDGVRVTSRPIYLGAITKKEHTNDNAYILNHMSPTEGWKEILVSGADFHASAFSSVLAKEGLSSGTICNYKLFKSYIAGQLEAYEKGHAIMTRYEQFGWKNEKKDFLIGRTLYRQDSNLEQVPLSSDISPLAEGFGPNEGASLDEWRKCANQLLSEELYPIGAGLVCSFAAPILGLCLNPTDGGVILHFWSDTGRGKSKVIEAADSVWGVNRRTVCTANDTLNALFKRISILNNLPAQIDEFNQSLDPAMIAQIVKRFTVGRDKSYLKQNRELVLLENTFQTLLITTSNRSLLELIGMTRDDGAYARVVEILVDTKDSEIFKRSETITKVMAAHAGIAGHTFIKALVNPQIREAVEKQFQDLTLKYNGTSGPERRFINRFLAATELAAKIIKSLNIMELDVPHLIQWLLDKVDDRPEISNDYLEIMGQFVTEKAHECLAMADTNMLNPVAPRNVNIRYDKIRNHITVPISYLKEWCIKKNINTQMLRKFLDEQNIFMGEVIVSLSAGTSITSGKRRCWRLDSTKIISSDGIISLVRRNEGETNEVV